MRTAIGVLSVLIFTGMVAGSMFLPTSSWVIVVPSVAFLTFQLIALLHPAAERFFQFGDYFYYLVIGSVLGLGGLTFEKSQTLSEFLNDEAYRGDKALLAALTLKAEQLEKEKALSEVRLATAKSAARVAKEDTESISNEVHAACSQRMLQDRLEDTLNWKRKELDRGIPQLPDILHECRPIESTMLKDAKAMSALRNAETYSDYVSRELEETRKQKQDVAARVDRGAGGTWPWDDLSKEQRWFYLLQLFPCLLMTGISIKIGKTTTAVLKDR